MIAHNDQYREPGPMVISRRAKQITRRAAKLQMAWQEFFLLSFFLVSLGFALTATVADGPMSQKKGAWLAKVAVDEGY